MRHPIGRRPRGRAAARPGAKAGDRAGTRAQGSTSPSPAGEACSHEAAALTEAQVLVGVASWLANLRDWLAEEIDLTERETVALPRAVAERMGEGLTRCIGALEALPVDPAQFPQIGDAASAASAPPPVTPSTRTLQ